jgi:hypothetical protein
MAARVVVMIVDKRQGRYLLFLDILGFSKLVEDKGTEEIKSVINHALEAFNYWESVNERFQTIYFSDSFIFYQNQKGYANAYFLDVYAIGKMILSALLAKGIPARGSIAFGEFEVDNSGKHQVYFGRALIEACRAEKKENWIGITILKSAWFPYEEQDPGNIAAFERERVWIKRNDEVLLLNPFGQLCSLHFDYLVGEITTLYMEWNVPMFSNDILGFKFLREKSDEYSKISDFSGKIATKYRW